MLSPSSSSARSRSAPRSRSSGTASWPRRMRASPERSTTSSPHGSTPTRAGRGKWLSMREGADKPVDTRAPSPSRDLGTRSVLEPAQEVLAGQEAWVVGGAVRDELLGRELVDLDIAVRDPRQAARAFAERSGGAPFALSEQHGAWRVALEDGRTVDFTPLPEGSIEDDLAKRDFTLNAIARPLAGGDRVDPFGGRADLEARRLRAVGESVFRDDPLRLLRAVRLEDELELQLDDETEALVRRDAELVTRPAGERILAELRRVSAGGLPRARGSRPAASGGSMGSACSPRSAGRSTTGSTAGTRGTTAWRRSSARASAAS